MNYSELTTECLIDKKKSINTEIKDYEDLITKTHSMVYSLYLRFLIKRLKENEHRIDAELAYRKQNGLCSEEG